MIEKPNCSCCAEETVAELHPAPQAQRLPKKQSQAQEQSGRSNYSNEPSTHISHLNKHVVKLFEEWKVEREIKVMKVFQDSPLQAVFCDSHEIYYVTTRLPHLQFVVQHTLMLECQTG